MTTPVVEADYLALNALLNLFDPETGGLQISKDKDATRAYFENDVNERTRFFHSLREKLHFFWDHDLYEREFLQAFGSDETKAQDQDGLDWDYIKGAYKHAYGKKFRFESFVGAYKFYTAYAMKSNDGKLYLERYEDRVVACALYLAEGDKERGIKLIDEIMSGRFQPATPTFLNAGKKQRGELVSCFLQRTEDSSESIARVSTNAKQLSRRGGGVAQLLTNLREAGAPIKNIEDASSGIVPFMKGLENDFSYFNQLGQRNGSGAVYLNIFHPEIETFLDTKRENADEKIRIKTLSLGVVVPDVFFELMKNNETMWLFSPYDVQKVYGVPFSDISVTEKYRELVEDDNIRKYKMDARKLFKKIAEVQAESGYPYLMFEDNVNKTNPIDGWINMSNLCTEIFQVNTASTYREDGFYDHVGRDISCNLGSMNIAKAMDGGDLAGTVETAIRALTTVSDLSSLDCAPSIKEGNAKSHAIGLGQMNLHGYLAREMMAYGSEEGLDFTNMYFYTVNFHAISASNKIAQERTETFFEFEKSKYATGEYFDKYTETEWAPATDRVREIFAAAGIHIPTQADWDQLKASVMEHGLYNAYLQAIPPTGSISYINNATASVHPIAAVIEARKEGKLGQVYYPAPHLNDENIHLFQDAYELGYKPIIDTYAIAQQHVDQGMSLTLFFKEGVNTRDINQAQIYAWRKGIKSLYYIRLRKATLVGTEQEGCVSCAL